MNPVRIVPLAIRMMDNAIDVSRFPLPQQAEEARAKRRIGLGVTGLADALILCGARYASEKAVRLTESWMGRLRRASYGASIELAREKGAFPLFDRERYLAGENIATLDADLREGIARHGIRNALVTSIAPTGTISILADNVSSGLEPVFSFNYVRNLLMPDGSRRTEEVSDYAYRLFRARFGDAAELPEAFVDAQHLSPSEHVVMQAAVQKRTTTAVEHHHFLVLVFLVQAISECCGCWFVDDAAHLQSGDLTGFLGGLALRIVEVRRHGDHRFGNRGA